MNVLVEMEKAYKIAHTKLRVWKISIQKMCKKCQKPLIKRLKKQKLAHAAGALGASFSISVFWFYCCTFITFSNKGKGGPKTETFSSNFIKVHPQTKLNMSLGRTIKCRFANIIFNFLFDILDDQFCDNLYEKNVLSIAQREFSYNWNKYVSLHQHIIRFFIWFFKKVQFLERGSNMV